MYGNSSYSNANFDVTGGQSCPGYRDVYGNCIYSQPGQQQSPMQQTPALNSLATILSLGAAVVFAAML
jgi:hypothetical protein